MPARATRRSAPSASGDTTPIRTGVEDEAGANRRMRSNASPTRSTSSSSWVNTRWPVTPTRRRKGIRPLLLSADGARILIVGVSVTISTLVHTEDLLDACGPFGGLDGGQRTELRGP